MYENGDIQQSANSIHTNLLKNHFLPNVVHDEYIDMFTVISTTKYHQQQQNIYNHNNNICIIFSSRQNLENARIQASQLKLSIL